jgi:ABC-type bacteriocin/lantibiotic exporter with double-glycine peptidase domain
MDLRETSEQETSYSRRIDRVLQLNIGIFRIKFSMNLRMNLCNHLQVVAALLIGGWLVQTDQLAVGGVVAFISAVGQLNDPWGDLVSYFRELSITRVKFRLLSDIVYQLPERQFIAPIDGRQALQPRT